MNTPIKAPQTNDLPGGPQGESPLISELVADQKLPPVEQRLGVDSDGDGVWESEPIVMYGGEGIGNYGGTWYRLAPNSGDLFISDWRLAGSKLLRYTPQADRMVPHLAKRIDVNEDATEYTIHLRKGARWSDGHLFTVNDFLFVVESEVALSQQLPSWLRIKGVDGELTTKKLEKPIEIEGVTYEYDPWTVIIKFPEANGFFYDRLASMEIYQPAHYLRQYHPVLGDSETIAAKIESVGAAGPEAMYNKLGSHLNNERPKLQAWIYRRPSKQSPWTWIRNPYFPVVDPEGNQLPYLDQVSFKQIAQQNLTLDVAQGGSTFQLRHLKFSDYTYLATNQDENGFQLRYWFPATRGVWSIFPNMNRVIDETDPSTKKRQELLQTAEFRQALSLAINRQAVIDAEFNGIGTPAQLDPGPGSPFTDARLRQAWTDFDPERANQLLDSIGLTNRDGEGMRTFADGSA